MVLSIIYGLMILRFKANMIVVGIATNLMAFGLTSFLLRAAFGESGVYRPTNIEPLPYINIPFIEDIPVIGQALSGHTILVYISLLFIVVTYLLLFKTSLGINIRAVGEHPQSARTAGHKSRIDPNHNYIMERCLMRTCRGTLIHWLRF